MDLQLEGKRAPVTGSPRFPLLISYSSLSKLSPAELMQ
jgi:hypothetical protein